MARKVETKRIRVPFSLLLGAPKTRKANRIVRQQAADGWQLVSSHLREGLFGIGGGIILKFRRPR